jgi:hypothetical protein
LYVHIDFIMSQLAEISNQFKELKEKYNLYLPKVDPALINDLLLRQSENPSVIPHFMVEIFVKPGVNTEELRAAIKQKTSMNPAMYDDNSHCVITQKLTMGKLKELSELNDVLEITGKYIGGMRGNGTFPEQRHKNENYEQQRSPQTSSSSSLSVIQRKKDGIEVPTQSVTGQQGKEKKSRVRYQTAFLAAIGIIVGAALIGFIISGGMLPNANQDSVSQNVQTQTPSTPRNVLAPGALHGYVEGPTGLPAIGASVIAANQETGYTANTLISVTGQYLFNTLPEGEYLVMVAYPDGTNDVVNDFQILGGSNHELDFSY